MEDFDGNGCRQRFAYLSAAEIGAQQAQQRSDPLSAVFEDVADGSVQSLRFDLFEGELFELRFDALQ